MTTISDKELRLRKLNAKFFELRKRLDDINEQRVALRLEVIREKHPCECVKLNQDIGVFDMVGQQRDRRNALSIGGLVSETLSAAKDCAVCNGTGVPGGRKDDEDE